MINLSLFSKLGASRKGASLVFFSATLTVIAAFAALSLDIGVLVVDKSRLAATMDSAALAAAQEMISDAGNTVSTAESYILKNISEVKNITVDMDAANRTVEVSGVKSIKYSFARLFGKGSSDIYAAAKAKVENIRSIKGSRPLAIVQQTFIYGTQYTLKEGGGDGTTGNYAAIALGGTGGSIYRDNLLYGYSGAISVGDLIQTETGNIAGTTQTSINQLMGECIHTPACTYQSYNRNCSKIIFLPVVDTLDVNGRKYVKVLGFATFFLEGVSNHGGHADVIGRFITYNMQGETSSSINDYGTYGIRLIK